MDRDLEKNGDWNNIDGNRTIFHKDFGNYNLHRFTERNRFLYNHSYCICSMELHGSTKPKRENEEIGNTLSVREIATTEKSDPSLTWSPHSVWDRSSDFGWVDWVGMGFCPYEDHWVSYLSFFYIHVTKFDSISRKNVVINWWCECIHLNTYNYKFSRKEILVHNGEEIFLYSRNTYSFYSRSKVSSLIPWFSLRHQFKS